MSNNTNVCGRYILSCFQGRREEWTGNSFKDSYIYISSTRIMSPNGKGIDNHSTWFYDCRDMSSTKKEMGVDVEYMIHIWILQIRDSVSIIFL
jgi:hypothetical protein